MEPHRSLSALSLLLMCAMVGCFDDDEGDDAASDSPVIGAPGGSAAGQGAGGGGGANPAGPSGAGLPTIPVPPARPVDAHVLVSGNKISGFSTELPAAAPMPTALTGVAEGDVLVTIDRRPQNGHLYGLGYNATAKSATLYVIHPALAFAAPVGAPVILASEVTHGGATFGMDFNPSVDRVRVVTSAGANFRMNPNNGALVDADPSVPGAQPDGAIKGAATSASETAYTNSTIHTTVTTQYTISGGTLYIQNPPNTGTLTAPVNLINVGSVLGFDIAPGVNTTTANAAPASGMGIAVFTSASQAGEQLASIDLVSGQLGVLGTFPFTGIKGMALQKAAARSVVGLSLDGRSLVCFLEDVPGTVTTTSITNISLGDQLVGIDYRPATGQLYALGVNPSWNTATLYLVDPQTAAVTVVGSTGMVSFVDKDGAQIDMPDPATTHYAVDFNPAVDRVRVVTSTGMNFRINPNTGGAVDGDDGGAAGSVPGTNLDGALSGANTRLDGVAYTNGPATTLPTTPGITSEYGLDSSMKALHLVTAPNKGTLGAAIPIRLGEVALDFTSVSGFDIPQSVTATAANAAVADGSAYAALTVGGKTGLYRIHLATGVATALGPIGEGTVPLAGLAVGQ